MEKALKDYRFKTRYDNDEKFREKHKKYMCGKTKCECGQLVTRNYMTRHRRTLKHAKNLKRNKKVI